MKGDLDRYSRQMLLPGFGREGQRRLSESTVCLLGCGALGSFAADLLARAGVGHLIIVDRDFVELSNLQRQILFDESDVAEALPKAIAAKRKIAGINADVTVTAVVDDIDHRSITAIATGADLLVDGLDNLETRYLANDFAVRNAVAYVYGAAVGTTGMAFTVLPHTGGKAPWEQPRDWSTPCFRCLFEEPPPPGSAATCDTVGVLSSLVGLIASYQVTESLKFLTGNFADIDRRMLNVDVRANEYLHLKVDRARDSGECPCCKGRRFDFLDGRAGSSAAVLCGRNAVQLRQRYEDQSVDLDALAGRLERYGRVRSNGFLLQGFITEGDKDFEITLFRNGRAIIKGTDEAEVARSIYARFVGT